MHACTPSPFDVANVAFWQELGSEEMVDWTFNNVAALFVSCALGCGISYFAFACRKALSATTFTVVG